MSYAEGTSVPVGRTRGQIETIVQKYGASECARVCPGLLARRALGVA